MGVYNGEPIVDIVNVHTDRTQIFYPTCEMNTLNCCLYIINAEISHQN